MPLDAATYASPLDLHILARERRERAAALWRGIPPSAPPYSFPHDKNPAETSLPNAPLKLSVSISVSFLLNLLSLGLFVWLLKRTQDLQRISAMRLLDRDNGVDSSIGTSVFKWLSETGKFSSAELAELNPQIDAVIKDGRAKWLEEELPEIVGESNAATLRKTFQEHRFNP